MRPTESGTRCSFAINRSLRFMARTIVSRSSWVPAPTCEPAPAGPHCLGGGALTEVRLVWLGLRLRVPLAPVWVPSLPITFAVMFWMADHELPHIPDSVLAGLRGLFGFCPLGALRNEDDGSEVTLRCDLGPAPLFDEAEGDAFLEVILDPFLLAASSLASAAYMSSSTDINLRVRGRSVELLLDDDSEAPPLAGFMACAHQAGRVKLQVHTPSEWGGGIDAWHVFTSTWQLGG